MRKKKLDRNAGIKLNTKIKVFTGMPAEEKRATVDTCFGLFGPHRHGVAKSKS